MLLRLKLPFSEPGISFSDFAPMKEDGALEVVLTNYEGTAVLYVTDDDVSQTVASPDNDPTAYFERLTVELSLEDPGAEVYEALQSGRPNDSSGEYAKKVFQIALGLHKAIVAWWRSTFRIFELEDINYHKGEEQRLLCEWNAEWLTPDKHWAPFVAGEKMQVFTMATVHISVTGTMERSRWMKQGPLVLGGKKLRMSDILIANAYQHLYQGEQRVAVIEAVTALEAGLKQLLAPILTHAQKDRMPGKGHMIKKTSTEAGLRLLTEVALPFALPELAIDDCWVGRLLPAIDLRNEIIHGPRRKVDPEEAHLAVEAVDALLAAMTTWHENSSGTASKSGS